MQDQELKDRLRDLQPSDDRGWAESASGRAVLDRVLHEDDQPSEVQPTRVRRWGVGRLGAVAAALVLVVAGAALVLDQTPQPGGGEAPPRGGSVPGFGSLPELVSASEVVVLGSVESVTRGEGGGVPDEEMVPWEVELRVEDQFLGAPVGERIVVEVDGAATDPTRPSERLARGDRMIYFLADTGDTFVVVALTGRFLVEDDGTVVSPFDDPASRALDGLGLPAAKQQIRTAVQTARG